MIPTHRLGYVADSILALIPRDPKCPHYTEDAFRRKLDLAEQRERRISLRLSDPGYGYLFQREWAVIIKRAKLTDRQLQVFLLRATGWTFEAIGKRYGHTKQGSQSIFLQAIKKIAVSQSVYPMTGLSDAYQELVSRCPFDPS